MSSGLLPSRQPDFSCLRDVLAGRRPRRPVLFEFAVNQTYLQRVAGDAWAGDPSPAGQVADWIRGFAAAGFDHATLPLWATSLPRFHGLDRDRLASVGMAHGGVITDRASFAAYAWPDFEAADYEGELDRAAAALPDGMQLIVFSPGGVLENLVSLCGYEELCLLLADDPALVREIAAAIGSRLLHGCQRLLPHPAVGAAFVNDDWGFKTQTMLSHSQMREFVTPWHRRLVEAIHAHGKPAILHSCGNLGALWEDVIEDLHFDAKHSFEDTILPVEEAWDRYGSRLAILGGLDLDFLCRSTPAAIEARARALLARTGGGRGYALGSGNSIPAYVPFENWLALQRCGF